MAGTHENHNKLTDPPRNLKEAIDWVLRVSGKDSTRNDGIKGLAGELISIFNEDARMIAGEVLEIIGPCIEAVTIGLEEANIGLSVLRGLLKNVKDGFRHVNNYGSRVTSEQITTLKERLNNVGESGGLISLLSKGLEKFIGYSNGNIPTGSSGIGQSGYESSYNPNATWSSIQNTEPDKKKCAFIFLGICPIIFHSIANLYWRCASTGGNLWSKHQIDGDGSPRPGNGKKDLKLFLEKLGFDKPNMLNTSKTGEDIVNWLDSGFNELKIYVSQTTEYSAALAKLQHPGSNSTSSLYLCHLITFPFITPNYIQKIDATNPSASSFLGYAGGAGLVGGAYGTNAGGIGTILKTLLA